MTEPASRNIGRGLKSIHDMKYVQDGPPAGGFPAIRYARRLGAPGPTGVAIFGVGAAICAYGFYRVGQANIKRNEYLKEKLAARKAILPILQAEEDIRYVSEMEKLANAQKEVMSNSKHRHSSSLPKEMKENTSGIWVAPARPLGSKANV